MDRDGVEVALAQERLRLRRRHHPRLLCLSGAVSGFGIWDSGSGFRVSGFWFRV
jgi:hypothetical protein